MSKSTAVALSNHKPTGEAEKIPAITALAVPAALLLAAEAVTAKAGGPVTSIEGVYLHAKGDRGRIVGTDGARMFVGSFPLPTKVEGGTPPWMHEGVTLSREGLRARVALISKLSDSLLVSVAYAKGNASVELSDSAAQSVFRVPVLTGAYPNYEAALGSKSFVDLDDEGQQEGREWQPVGINSGYLKQCGDIAKTLEAGLPKEMRSKLGMVIRAFNGGGADAPLVFDFSSYPGAILVVMPVALPTKMLSKETAMLLAPAVKMTIAALKAHATRWDQRAAEAAGDRVKAEATGKADEFRARIAAIMATVPAGPAISGEKKKPEAEAKKPEPQAEKPEPQGEKPQGQAPEGEKPAASGWEAKAAEDQQQAEQPQDEAGGGQKPATKRTKIKVPTQQSAAA